MSTEIRTRSKSPCKITVTDDDETNKRISNLVKQRAIVKGRLTRFCNYVSKLQADKVLPVETQVELKLRIQGATNLFSEFSILQTQLEELVLETDLDQQLDQREVFEDCYYLTMAQAECVLGTKEHIPSSKTAPSDPKSVKLPTISIPTFDGSCERWLEFRDIFQSLIHNSDQITTIQKFHYLKSSLKGSAALVIDSLEFSAANYIVAWELLLTRYDNSRLLIHNHIRSLFTIQALTKEAPDSLRNLIDTILKNLRALNILGEPIDDWDTILIYMIVTKLDKVTEREWEQQKTTYFQQSGDSKSKMKIEVLLTFLKDRADMLETLLVSHGNINNSSKKQITSSHNNNKIYCNVSTSDLPRQSTLCSLCSNHKHPPYTCKTFINSNLEARLKLVKESSLCENCLRPGHSINNCKFGTCRKCDLKHNTLIHQDSEASRNEALHTSSEDSKPAFAMH